MTHSFNLFVAVFVSAGVLLQLVLLNNALREGRNVGVFVGLTALLSALAAANYIIAFQ